MDFTEEQVSQIKEIGLSDEQFGKLKPIIDGNEAVLKKEWDGLANTNAEGILNGVAKSIETLTGIKKSADQKYAQYIEFAGENYLKGQKSDLDRQKEKLDQLIKDGKPSEQQQAKYDELQVKYDALQQKEATFKDWEENDYKSKWEIANKELSETRRQGLFNASKPNFPDTVNKYEAIAVWDEFQANIEAKYNIEKGENGKMVLVDKDNKHIVKNLNELVKVDDKVQALLKKESSEGAGSGVKKKEVEGLPFSIPETATKDEIAKLITENLSKKYDNILSDEYSNEFSKLYSIAIKNTTTKG